LNRADRDRLEKSGLFIDNDAIKNFAEDAEDLWEEFEDVMDVKNPLMQE